MMIACIFILMLLASPVWAGDYKINFSYDEPTTQATGNALDDLAKTKVYFKHADGTDWITPKEFPATNVSGGGQIVSDVTVVDTSGQIESGTLEATAIDTNGNESLPIIVNVPIDSEAPSSPKNVTATVTISSQ